MWPLEVVQWKSSVDSSVLILIFAQVVSLAASIHKGVL